jgi:IS1 family transposase
MVGVDKKTVLRLLADVGTACAAYHDDTVRGLKSVRVQCDEIWSFCHAKERNIPFSDKGERVGDMWTWTAIDADTKLVISWVLGKRTLIFAREFARDLAQRVSSYVQISTDGLAVYKEAFKKAFRYRADYGTEVKVFGPAKTEEYDSKYSPSEVKEVVRTRVWGAPDPRYISTAYVERQNLTMRMSMRRFTRLTNAFSKKIENLEHALALHFMHYNFCRKHQTLKTTPALAAGLTDRLWTIQDLANLPDFMRGGLAA